MCWRLGSLKCTRGALTYIQSPFQECRGHDSAQTLFLAWIYPHPDIVTMVEILQNRNYQVWSIYCVTHIAPSS